MSVNNPTPTAPIPLRPLNRTRRRSSSLSAIYTSSPELDQGQFSPQLRPDRKNTKRSRVTRNPPSPLKHSQPVANTTATLQLGSDTDWSHLSPSRPLAQNPLPPPHPAFTSSAFDFSLPSTTNTSLFSTAVPRPHRTRTTSSPSTSTLQLPSFETRSSSSPSSSTNDSPRNPLTINNYETNFADSSFSSFASNSSSTPPSPPSAATSPPSPPTFGFLSSTIRKHLGESSDEMECDQDQGGTKTNELEGEEEVEAERLYHVAFEQLRKTTREDEESFVERMRRWEEEKEGIERRIPEPILQRTRSTRGGGGAGREEEGSSLEADDEEEEEEEDEEDQLEFKVEVDPPSFGPSPSEARRKVTQHELDELTTRFKSGACELEDYGLVRQVQQAHRRLTSTR
ncbi:hypothetical protein JCM16303_007009 [Sporobolomyces ruberrimus]